jgi:hypothetical protein
LSCRLPAVKMKGSHYSFAREIRNIFPSNVSHHLPCIFQFYRIFNLKGVLDFFPFVPASFNTKTVKIYTVQMDFCFLLNLFCLWSIYISLIIYIRLILLKPQPVGNLERLI